MDVLIGFSLAVIVPLLSLGIIRKLDLFQTGRFKWILGSFGWGVVAFVLASLLNRSLAFFGAADRNTIILFYAPIHEEILKGLVLLLMIKRTQITYSVDGALYGFAAGVGFAVYENFEYIFRHITEAVEISAYRVGSANLVHASGSAILGIALGMIHLKRTPLRWLAFALGLFLSIGQHMIYNKISLEGEPLAAAMAIGLSGVLFVAFAMQLGKKQARKWITQKLEIGERITQGEIAAVEQLANTKDLLLPVYERFGLEKALQVERLLYLEARLGIKREALDNLQKDSPLHKTLEAEIGRVRTEIKAMRRNIGIYAMLFVRGLFTQEMVSVWERVQAKIQERSAVTGSRKGGGLWSTLEGRLKASGAKRHE